MPGYLINNFLNHAQSDTALKNKSPFILFLLLFAPGWCISQGTGYNIINQTFGEGEENPGSQLAAGKTAFVYSQDTCLAKGTYTIINSLYRCPRTRMGRSLDNTPSSRNGYMMLVSPPGDKEMVVYLDTLKQALCPNTSYDFSAYILNASIPNNCSRSNPPLPQFRLSVETIDGVKLQSINTGTINYAYDLVRTPKFSMYTASFMVPAGVNGLVLKITSLSYGVVACDFYVAIDDIQLAASGPKAAVVFENTNTNEWIKQICFAENKTLKMNGVVDAYYANTRMQWQQSSDSGLTWRDIAGATLANYAKTFSVADTFMFRLSAADAVDIGNVNCRVVSNILKVEVNGIPKGFKVTTNSPVCVGVDVIFDSEAGEGLHYDWTGPNGFHDDAYYPSVNHTQLKDSGMYYVTVSTVGGCHFRDSTYVKVYGIGAVTAGNDTSICLGSSVQLRATSGTKIRWSPVNSLSDSTITDPVATPVSTTTYSVKVTDLTACVSAASVTIKLLNKVAVKGKLAGSNFLCRPADTATLHAISEGDVTNWNWDFGNGQTSSLENPPAINYSIANDVNFYNARLIVTDSSGCSDTAHHKIQVVDNCYIAVPTGFTPNGDGKNDYLYPVNAYKTTDLIFRVYSRNGQVVFETKDWTKKWDGRINGMLQPTGVYVWTLNYTDESKKKVSLKGTATLIR
jgi:gliding motility-associated-like protein